MVARANNPTDVLVQGNKKFRSSYKKGDFAQMAKGQEPPFLVLGCADSRSNEGTIFNSKLGQIFTTRNIANQFLANDTNAHSVVTYGVSALGVQHVLVMGHYGCGGVAAAMTPAPSLKAGEPMGLVMDWIAPIREVYRTSTRKEIVDHRDAKGTKKEPKIDDPAFRALVEENVKASVRRLAESSAMKAHNELLKSKGKRAAKKGPVDVFVHGVVYDVATGEVKDLDISVGPEGAKVPKLAFEKVQQKGIKGAVQQVKGAVSDAVDKAKGAISKVFGKKD